MEVTTTTEYGMFVPNADGTHTRSVLVLVLECTSTERAAFGTLPAREYDVRRAWHVNLGLVRADGFELRDMLDDLQHELRDIPGIVILHDYVLPDVEYVEYVEHFGMRWRSRAFGRMAKARERALRSTMRPNAHVLALRSVRGIAAVYSYSDTPQHDVLLALAWTAGFEFVDGPTNALRELAGSVIDLNDLNALRD